MMTASPHWRRLRQAALKRDGYRCTVPGCFAPAPIVDHIVTRPSGFVVGHALRAPRRRLSGRTPITLVSSPWPGDRKFESRSLQRGVSCELLNQHRTEIPAGFRAISFIDR
jgi:hypothetical protein